MEKIVPRGLITSGPLDSLTEVCIGFHVGAWRVISKSGLGSGQGSGSSHTRLQNRPWCSNRLSQAMPYRITLTVRTGLPQGSRRLGAGVLGGVRKLPIENRVHWVRDVTFDEDRCQIRTASAPGDGSVTQPDNHSGAVGGSEQRSRCPAPSRCSPLRSIGPAGYCM